MRIVARPHSPALPAAKAAFQRALHAWYRGQHRRLPWRVAPSLYRTVISEFMLQQTQVKTVLPYFESWVRALPDFAALAAASEARVLKLWEGLGYYSRARNLHRLARVLAARPAPPRTTEAWRELPGVGPYTAAAITSLAFGAPAACVDGNVVRVLARLTADGTTFRDSAAAAKHFTPLAAALLPRAEPGLHNQAMMELGALECSRHHPRCTICPVRRFCAAARRGDPENYPRLVSKKIKRRAVTRVWCEHPDACCCIARPRVPAASPASMSCPPPLILDSTRRRCTRLRGWRGSSAASRTTGLPSQSTQWCSPPRSAGDLPVALCCTGCRWRSWTTSRSPARIAAGFGSY